MPKPKNNKKILIVEDAVDYQFLLRRLLEMEGYELFCADNGLAALDFLNAQTELPNLILLDIMMPIMDGIEFKKRQSSDPRFAAIPVVVMTAHAHAADSRPILEANAYIDKPADLEVLLNTVHQHCA